MPVERIPSPGRRFYVPAARDQRSTRRVDWAQQILFAQRDDVVRMRECCLVDRKQINSGVDAIWRPPLPPRAYKLEEAKPRGHWAITEQTRCRKPTRETYYEISDRSRVGWAALRSHELVGLTV